MGVLCSGCQSYGAPQGSADLSEPGASFPCPPEGGEDTGGRRRVSRSSVIPGAQPPRGSLLRQEWGSTDIRAQRRAWGSLPVGRVTDRAGVSLLLRCPLPWTPRRRTMHPPPCTPLYTIPLYPPPFTLPPPPLTPAHVPCTRAGWGGFALPPSHHLCGCPSPTPGRDGRCTLPRAPTFFPASHPCHPTLSLPLGAWGPLVPPSSLPRLEGERPARDAAIQSLGTGADPGLRGPIPLSIY